MTGWSARSGGVAVAGALLLAVAAAGCGGDDDGGEARLRRAQGRAHRGCRAAQRQGLQRARLQGAQARRSTSSASTGASSRRSRPPTTCPTSRACAAGLPARDRHRVRAGRCDRHRRQALPGGQVRDRRLRPRAAQRASRQTPRGSSSVRSRLATSSARSPRSAPSATGGTHGQRRRRQQGAAGRPVHRRLSRGCTGSGPGHEGASSPTRRTGTTRRSARSSRSIRSPRARRSCSRSPESAGSARSPLRRTRSVWGIGVDADQSFLGPHVLTSALKGVDQAVFLTVKAVQDGTWQGGGNAVFGLDQDGVGLGTVSGKVPAGRRRRGRRGGAEDRGRQDHRHPDDARQA